MKTTDRDRMGERVRKREMASERDIENRERDRKCCLLWFDGFI